MADLQSKVKQSRLVEKIGKQGFHLDTKELIEPITKTVTHTSTKITWGDLVHKESHGSTGWIKCSCEGFRIFE